MRLINMWMSIGGAVLAVILSPALAGSALLYSAFISLTSVAILQQVKNKDGSIEREAKASTHKLILSHWLNDRGFLDLLVTFTRIFGSFALLLTNVVELMQGELLARRKTTCLLPLCENWNVEISVALIVSSLLLVDWCLICRLAKEIFKVSKLLENIAIAAVASLLFGGVLVLMRWAERFPEILVIFKYIGFATSGGAMAFVFGGLCVAAWKSLKDTRSLRSISLPTILARSEIARIFSGLATSYGRLRFVRSLERERITASGAWPSEFKLSVGQGEPMCALARLEERWLRLDR